MRTTAENRAAVEACGYEPIADFVLAQTRGPSGYYGPLRARIAMEGACSPPFPTRSRGWTSSSAID